jgi:hypothetical protein
MASLAAVDYISAGARMGATAEKGLAGVSQGFREWANIRDNKKYVNRSLNKTCLFQTAKK